MTAPRYCPFKTITNGFLYGHSPDAASHNKTLECHTDCAWFQHENCAAVNAAGSLWVVAQTLDTVKRLLMALMMQTAVPLDEEGQADDAPIS